MGPRMPDASIGDKEDNIELPESLTSKIQHLGGIGVLRTVCGLMLEPSLADATLLLETLAQAALLALSPSKGHVAPGVIKSLFRLLPDTVLRARDPIMGLFVEEVSFFGGAYRIIPGLTEGAAFLLETIARAIFHQEG